MPLSVNGARPGELLEISGEHRFRAPAALVWEALFDARALRASIPGCETLEEVAPGRFLVSIRVGVSGVRGQYSGEAVATGLAMPSSFQLSMAGRGENGAVQAEARVSLREEQGTTVTAYSGDLRAQGALARLGAPVLAGTAKLLLAQFFKEMERQVRDRTA